ncbi:hydantoinase B/oxoprolinase family protein [Candidatus Acetothermia bacterium]|nr:hydantoinase B/oxoprolinase family protein [Candidatus Acetothermia bacterium]MBI3660313.1 hydantoinase B/oxoprolinase family protein [Candidatus Acetothermia bacterium]
MLDPITLEVLKNSVIGAAEEMNAALIRASYSPNIKERRDCSCALFDSKGQMIAQAENIPVHLGAMPFSVAAALKQFSKLEPGDVIVLNDPFAGGAHLPDITFVTPIFVDDELIGFSANRAHHADVGGMRPGSIAGDATEIFQEGLRIPPVKLWRAGQLDRDLWLILLANVRTPQEREGDLRAQYAANEIGRQRLVEIAQRYGKSLLRTFFAEILDYAERRMRAAIAQLAPGIYSAHDFLDDDGINEEPVPIRATVTIEREKITVDFSGSAPQVQGPLNAVFAVTASATYYTLRCLTDPAIPPNAGCYRPLEINAPEGTIVNAKMPAAVVGGNLETSQRIVDVLFRALALAVPEKAIAGCQGTMNSVTFGGVNPRTGEPFTFYETLAGGFGARPDKDGISAIHSHMTNTLNTPVEVLETLYPVRVERYEIREGSGGKGKFRGGDGLIREIRALEPMHFSLLADRRKIPPYGLAGGEPGACGKELLIRPGVETSIKAKGSIQLTPGDRVRISTPGGGGFGSSS